MMLKKTGRATALAVLLSCVLTLGICAEDALPESDILNVAVLTPTVTGVTALDTLVDDTMEELIDSEMDTYEQVKACYDYLLENMSYSSSMNYLHTPVGEMTCGDLFYTYGEVDGFGAVALAANKGLCNGYSAGFILMARRLGLDAKLVEGSTLGAGGSYAYHKWTEIVIDGTTYVFDPQLDQDVVSWGLPAYSFFCKTYEQTGRRYRLA